MVRFPVAIQRVRARPQRLITLAAAGLEAGQQSPSLFSGSLRSRRLTLLWFVSSITLGDVQARRLCHPALTGSCFPDCVAASADATPLWPAVCESWACRLYQRRLAASAGAAIPPVLAFCTAATTAADLCGLELAQASLPPGSSAAEACPGNRRA
jgi:hypothetical protein